MITSLLPATVTGILQYSKLRFGPEGGLNYNMLKIVVNVQSLFEGGSRSLKKIHDEHNSGNC